MEQPNSTISRSAVSLWFQAVRPFSFTAHIVPILVGAMLATNYHGEVSWSLFILVALCSLLFHAGTNLVSDYYDYKKEVDRDGTYGSSGVLLGGLLNPQIVLKVGLLLFGIGFALGLIMVNVRGLPILYLGIVGLLGGVFYCATPIGYKYIGLGDFLVFMLMGPLMVIGSYFVLTGDYNNNVLYVSLPIGFLVTAILNANNLRDINADAQAKIKTFANVIGLTGSKIEYFLLVLGAYLSVIVMVSTGILQPYALIVFLSVPPALKNLKAVSGAELDKSSEIAMIDIQTAQHHFLFGILLAIGILLSHFL